jgi:hypothetical protein
MHDESPLLIVQCHRSDDAGDGFASFAEAREDAFDRPACEIEWCASHQLRRPRHLTTVLARSSGVIAPVPVVCTVCAVEMGRRSEMMP